MSIITAIFLVLGALLVLLVIWGLIEPRVINRVEHTALIPNLPEGWVGKRIALIADLHVGMFLDNTGTIRRIVKQLALERPAVVLIAGDFVHDTNKAIGKAVELVRPLPRAGIPTYAVLGNHDYAMPTKDGKPNPQLAAELARALEAAGVQVLCNEAVPLELSDSAYDDTPLHLIGIGAHTPGLDRPAEALARLPDEAPRVVMMHHPTSFEKVPPGSAPFAVAGHTHGGQVRLPFAPIWSYLSYKKDIKVYVGGWIISGMIEGYGEPGNHIYVTRGIGMSAVPLRIACPPELTVFTLQKPA